MSSDEAYTAFLDKANEIPLAGGNISTQSAETKAAAVNTNAPTALQSIDKYYISETDEPFVPAATIVPTVQALLTLLTPITSATDEFRDLIDHKADISIIDTDDWDPRGDYVYIIRAVREAAGVCEVKVYKIHYDRTRAEYYVVSLDSDGSRIVGLKAKAVES
ncbi:hypothetical protein FGG08_001042 [Glutinoglossum americanum]|uniref:Uncharacterized protein n=1 Tax=Glutinoglossum americanum TaxID=1670608 RepID=A0A9P8L0M1_9PEZI|nr:hypothetical protein FGG08_001042 [Glutinoglossum americanum]